MKIRYEETWKGYDGGEAGLQLHTDYSRSEEEIERLLREAMESYPNSVVGAALRSNEDVVVERGIHPVAGDSKRARISLRMGNFSYHITLRKADHRTNHRNSGFIWQVDAVA